MIDNEQPLYTVNIIEVTSFLGISFWVTRIYKNVTDVTVTSSGALIIKKYYKSTIISSGNWRNLSMIDGIDCNY